MQYDFYNEDEFYKPGLAKAARDRLHRILFQDLEFKSILEVGIGFGELADYSKRSDLNWTGVDANENLLEVIRKRGFPAYHAWMPKFPEIKEDFDLIFAAHFIEHLKDYQEALEFIHGCKQKLSEKKGRYLVLLFPDIEKIGTFFFQDYTHSFVTSKKRIEDMLYDTGWKIVKSGRYTSCFFATSGIISFLGKFFPFFLLPKKIALFARLSLQQHSYVIAELPRE